MKLTLLLASLPLIAPALGDRTKEAWVEDLRKVTQDYEKLVSDSQQKGITPNRIYYAVTFSLDQSRRDLQRAANFQLTAANPNPAHGYQVVGIERTPKSESLTIIY
ncbi:hypothetical protein IFM51744_10939 [Aspergillus udagawae]|nr:hypothetical protein IFM51744_10939 [Aspergillus udagawae]